MRSDIDFACENWVQIKTGQRPEFNGELAAKLLNSRGKGGFKVCPCSFSVWEVTEDEMILRANQKLLECALRYMGPNKVLVHNADYPEVVTSDLVETKEQAREYAIQWQSRMSEQNPSWGELMEQQGALRKLADRFGLNEEFKENGIL